MNASIPTDLSIIIVNWNSVEYVRKCLDSIAQANGQSGLEVIVIDNGSFDGCGEMIKRDFPAVQFMQNDNNVGFSRANNLAFGFSRGRHVLFLNPDTIVHRESVECMLRRLKSLPDAGAVCCRLLNADGTLQTTCVQAFPTIANQLFHSERIKTLFPSSNLWGAASLFSGQTEPVEVESLSGACLMVKREVFERVGLFSEAYFMYAEDIDLCYRIRQAGYKNYHVPDATVVHLGGGSSDAQPSDFSAVMMRVSIFRFMALTHGWSYAWAYRASLLAAAIGRVGCLLVLLPWYAVRGQVRRWYGSVGKWLAISEWSVGLRTESQRPS